MGDSLTISFDISTVQALIVTHCHIDHVDRIPYLLAAGFDGPILATEATIALLPLVIEDALKVGVTRNRSIVKACLSRLKKQQYGLSGGYVFIEDEKYYVKAEGHTLSGYSAHADQANLLNFVKRIRHRLKR